MQRSGLITHNVWLHQLWGAVCRIMCRWKTLKNPKSVWTMISDDTKPDAQVFISFFLTYMYLTVLTVALSMAYKVGRLKSHPFLFFLNYISIRPLMCHKSLGSVIPYPKKTRNYESHENSLPAESALSQSV